MVPPDLRVTFRNMLQKFDDTCFIGEILAAIADSIDQEAVREPSAERGARLAETVVCIGAAIGVLHTFGEDLPWPEWEAFLDGVHGADLAAQSEMLREIGEVLKDENWRGQLLELNRDGADFSIAIGVLEKAVLALKSVD